MTKPSRQLSHYKYFQAAGAVEPATVIKPLGTMYPKLIHRVWSIHPGDTIIYHHIQRGEDYSLMMTR